MLPPIYTALRTAILRLAEAQARFEGHSAQRFFAAHVEIPALAVAAYLLMVWAGPRYMAQRKPYKLRRISQVWNVSVAVFSMAGAYATAPHLLRQLSLRGLWYTACADPYELAGVGAPVLWAALFTWSKLFELFDTFLLIAKKRKLILLHWFHHASVIGFVWVAWIYETPLALWYGVMNYSVHSVMYSYFFAVSIDRRILRAAPFVTSLQLAQFAWGTVINLLVLFSWSKDGVGCAVHPRFLQIGGVMYFAYGSLFAQLFVERYVRKDGGRKAASDVIDFSRDLRCTKSLDAALKIV